MNRMMTIALIGIIAGCRSVQPWHGFLNKDYRPWQEYLEQNIDIEVSNKPLDDVLTEPLFPNFNCIIKLSGQSDTPPRVTMYTREITRREALWRMAQQCKVRMTVEGNVVLIVPKREMSKPAHAGDGNTRAR